MGSPRTRFAAIVFCLNAIAVLSFGNLIVLRHPPGYSYRSGSYTVTRMLTCYSEDDDSALVWNYNFQDREENIADDFQPKKSGLKTNSRCAIWNSTECVADWEKSSRWELVNSANKPMGPALDYRWEGFQEFVSGKAEVKLKYMELGDEERYSGTVVFSVRALRNFDVLLCHEKDVTKGPCFWIRIGYTSTGQSKVFSCVGGIPKFNESQADKNCTDIGNAWHAIPVVDEYEWRSFRIEWKSEERMIKLFRETEVDPFLNGTGKQWHSVSHIFIRSEISSRVRFHFYDYRLTQTKTELSTKQFDPGSEDFCVKLLVGLCRNCRLRVHLTDESGQHIAGNSIPGNKNYPDSVPLLWKPIYLNVSLKSPMPKLVRLKIETILNDNEGEGRWAVDSFLPCKSPGGLRKSTITTHRQKASSVSWPKAKCQKLSYSKGAVVDSLSTGTIDQDTSKFLMLVRNSVTSASYTSLGEAWSICNPTGCACDRGYIGDDCQNECTPGSYGYKCNEQCGSCSTGYCDGTNGNCPSGCRAEMYLPPFCNELERPIVEEITDTTARIRQNVESKSLEYVSSLRIFLTGGVGREFAITTTSFVGSTCTLNITELRAGTMYSLRTFVSTNISGEVTKARSPEISFVTSFQRCFEAESKNNGIVINMQRDLEECRVIGQGTLGRNYSVEFRKKTGKPIDARVIFMQHFPYTYEEVEPYTEYQLTVYKYGGKVIFWTGTVRSFPSAPSAVENWDFYDGDLDAKVVSLRWLPPNPANGEIESYHVRIEKGSPWKEWTIETSKGEGACKSWENYVCIKNLPVQLIFLHSILGKISARNKGVEAAGNSTAFLEFLLNVWYEAPGEPLNLTATHEGHGDVIFTWMHPSLSLTKITRFEITVDIQHSVLLEKLGTRYPVTVNYTITENQKYYAKSMALQPSTKYKVFVVAVNRRNRESEAITTEFSVPPSVGFANENKPQVTFNGTLIDVSIPTIVNSTLNTTLKVIVKGLSRCTPIHSQESSPSATPTVSVTEWDAAEYQVGSETPESVKIYIEQNRGVTSVCSLDPKEEYTIVFNVTDWYSGISVSTATSPIGPKSSLAWLASLLAVPAVCVLVVFIRYRSRKRVPRQLREPSYVEPIQAPLKTTTTVPNFSPIYQNNQEPKLSVPRRPSYLEILPPSSTTNFANNSIALDTLNISSHPASAENRSSAHLYTLPNEPDFCSVSIEDFDEYAKNAASSRLLYSQFTRLRVGLTSPCEYGRLPGNIPKNRSGNLIAYDDTRVVLEKIPGDPYSDYINASYIKGYKKERAYIAAQGPTPNTVNDFWRMVWEQKVGVICMLTNVTEGTETMCEKYWPDVGARVNHGGFLISNIDEQVFADYTFRTFKLNFKRKTQQVTHLHYTEWPSLGVPKNPQSLVAYLRKLEQTPTGNSPVLVHCSTGDDRTGTLILCDVCLHQAVAEKVINVIAVASRMRDSRANMVGTLQQYVLAHIIITESSVSRSTRIPCTDVLSSRMNKLRIRLPSDIQRLKDTAWQQQALQSSASTRPNGSPEKIYDDVFEKERNRIDAVSVDGVKVNEQNLACWLPSPLTLSDFWEFVAERDMKLIVILQCSDPGNPSCRDIIPGESIVIPTIRIEMKNRASLDIGEYFTREELLLTDTLEEKERSRTVTVLTCGGWGCGTVQKPPDPPALISLWRASEKIPRKEGRTLVLCHDGITACGLYLALSFLLERMTVEGECDVIAAVRAVRRSKPEFVQSMEQIEYLYDAAVDYVQSFQGYANFR